MKETKGHTPLPRSPQYGILGPVASEPSRSSDWLAAVIIAIVVGVVLLTGPPLWWHPLRRALGIESDGNISSTVLVHANTPVTVTGGGQSTGVHLVRGQELNITAMGQIIYGYEPVSCPSYPLTDPAGNRTSSVTGQSCG